MRRLLAIAVLAVFVGGCGRTEKDSAKDFKGPERQVAQAVEELQKAGSKRDGNKICEQLLARELIARVKQAGADDCVSAIDDVLKDADTFELQVKDVKVNGSSATATVLSDGGNRDRTDTLRLVRERNTWRIASLGDG